MNRKQFFGNMVGLVAVASNAKELASLKSDVPVVAPEMYHYTFANKCYVSALDPMIDTREINKMVTDILK